MVNLLHLSHDETVRLLTIFFGVSAACSVASYLWTKFCNFVMKGIKAFNFLLMFGQDKDDGKDPKSNGVGKTKDEDPAQEKLDKKSLDKKPKVDEIPYREPMPVLDPALIPVKQPFNQPDFINMPVQPILQPANQTGLNCSLANNQPSVGEIQRQLANTHADWRNAALKLELNRQQMKHTDKNILDLKDLNKLFAISRMAKNYFLQNCQPEKTADNKRFFDYKDNIMDKCHKFAVEALSLAKQQRINAGEEKFVPGDEKLAAEVIKELLEEYKATDTKLDFMHGVHTEDYVPAVQNELKRGEYSLHIYSPEPRNGMGAYSA